MNTDEIIIEDKNPHIPDTSILPTSAETFLAFKNGVESHLLSPMKSPNDKNYSYVAGYAHEIAVSEFITNCAEKLTDRKKGKKFYSDYKANNAKATQPLKDEMIQFHKKLSVIAQRLQLFVLASKLKASTEQFRHIINDEQLANNAEVYAFNEKICVVALDAHIEIYEKALTDLVFLANLMKDGLKSRRNTVLNRVSVVLHEFVELGTKWVDVAANHRRIDVDYDYERINRALARKDDATGDVAQIEQIVNSYITSGVKNTENKPDINFSPQVNVKPEINVQPCQPCPETPAEGTPSGS